MISTKNFVLCGQARCEARDASGIVISQYYRQGETISGNRYFFSKDNHGSVTELTDASGIIQAQYKYDCYGNSNVGLENVRSDFKYQGSYLHARSGLTLATFRQYSSSLGRWLSQDPLPEGSTANQYTFVQNAPTNFSDWNGLQGVFIGAPPELILRPTVPGPSLGEPVGGTPGGGTFIDPIGLIIPSDPWNPPSGSPGNPHWDCCKTQQCCSINANKCYDGCGYYYGDEVGLDPNGTYYNRCINCCRVKQGDCNRTWNNPGPKTFFGSCFSQGPHQPNTGKQA